MINLGSITSAISFLAMTTSLWLGSYIVTRSPRSRLAWHGGLTLWSLTGVFVDSLLSIDQSAAMAWWPGWLISVPLALWYPLSLDVLRGHEGRVINAAFSADGARIVTARHDGTARVWDAARKKPFR